MINTFPEPSLDPPEDEFECPFDDECTPERPCREHEDQMLNDALDRGDF